MPNTAWRAFIAATALSFLGSCETTPSTPTDPAGLVERGKQIFFSETFNGNGRTCGTCHRAEDNFGLSPAFIATLPPNDPLFVAETKPALARGFEAPRQMRVNGLILENLDGFDNLNEKFVLRGIPHTLALRTSTVSRDGNRLGWGGDGAPGDGSVRAFSVGAVVQHFTKTLARVPGEDFRLPTNAELDALEAFMLSRGRQMDLILPLPILDPVAARGQTLFLDDRVARCNVCHFNAGANANPSRFGGTVGNLNFNTGVENLPNLPGAVLGDPVPPRDDGFRIPGDGTFNTPPLVEAADTPPFFHNNAVSTIEAAVAFYNTDSFNNSPAGQFLRSTAGSPIALNATQVREIAAFLRVINALENIRETEAYVNEAASNPAGRAEAMRLAGEEVTDAIDVLAASGLSPAAGLELLRAKRLIAEDPPRPRSPPSLEPVLGALRDARAKILSQP